MTLAKSCQTRRERRAIRAVISFRIMLADDADGAAGRAGGEVILLQQADARSAAGQLVSGAAAADATSDDDDVGCCGAWATNCWNAA